MLDASLFFLHILERKRVLTFFWLSGLRTISVFATGVMGCVVVRRWKREREEEELVMQ